MRAAAARQGFIGALGHPSDDETGLIYMRARYYDPACGRFISEDPGRHGTNWYPYCDDDPVNQVDQGGRITISPYAFWLFWMAFSDFLSHMNVPPKLAAAVAFVASSKTAQMLLAQMQESLNLLDEIAHATHANGIVDPEAALVATQTAIACGLAGTVAVLVAAYQAMILFEFLEPGDDLFGNCDPFTSS